MQLINLYLNYYNFFSYSADTNGSRFIQQAIEVATTEEITMVYKEIMPYARVLSIDVFGNHAIQTVKFLPLDSIFVRLFYFILLDSHNNWPIIFFHQILNHGPQFYKRMFIDHLMGHVFELSSHMYGCRVIQKVNRIMSRH